MSIFMCDYVIVCFLLGDKQEVKFGGVMSAQNTHHIPVFYHVFGSFQLVISVFIALYLILGFSCISGEKCGIWRLCGDLNKEIGEPSLNITMSQHSDVEFVRRAALHQPNITTSPGLGQLEFQKRRKGKKMGGTRYEKEKTTQA